MFKSNSNGADDEAPLLRKRSMTSASSYGALLKAGRKTGRRPSEISMPSGIEKQTNSMPLVMETQTMHGSNVQNKASRSSINPNLYLMNGIICSPKLPPRRHTGIPLTMLEADFIELQRKRYWITKPKNETEDSMANNEGKHQERKNSLNGVNCTEKRGKVYISTEFQSEEDKLLLVVSQYGNLQADGKQLMKNWRSTIHVTFLSEDGTKETYIRKVDRSTTTDKFKYNYAFYFHSLTLEEVQKKALRIKLKTKKTMFSRRKLVEETEFKLDNVDVDPDLRNEILFHE